MKTIEVKAPYSYGEYITVQVFEDEVLVFCNHAGADVEEVDYGYADANKCDYVDDWRNSMVCDKCDNVEQLINEEY